MRAWVAWGLAGATALAACGGDASTGGGGDDDLGTSVTALSTTETAGADIKPSGRGGGLAHRPPLPAAAAAKKPARANGISYHGGPLMLGTVNVYYVWYGNWSGNTATTILQDLATSIGGSPWFNINASYTDGSGRAVANAVHFGGSVTDAYSHGTALGDADVQAVVGAALSSGRLPTDPNGVYFVLTSADVTEKTGFCTSYCGWHASTTLNGANVKYAFVGNPDRCPSACEEQTVGPNGNAGADGMASIIAHELAESVTDPNLNAWYDQQGRENADKCAWTFGTTYLTSSSARANVHLGTRDFLIQQNWVNASGGFCALSWRSGTALTDTAP